MLYYAVDTEVISDYCERRIDKISYVLTHKMYHDESDRQYHLGAIDAYEDIYRMICEEQIK